MSRFFLILVLALSTLTASAAESPDARPASMSRVGPGEIVRTAAPRVNANASPAQPPARENTEQSTRDVSWEMVLAAVALMTAIALRRFRSGPR